VIVLLDGSMDLTEDDREFIEKVVVKPLLPVLNKSDLPRRIDEELFKGLFPEGTPPAVSISAK
jgi:tRNA U34 5-carboxymethylaminomethyl modifying GTPase MnmE/TrmE